MLRPRSLAALGTLASLLSMLAGCGASSRESSHAPTAGESKAYPDMPPPASPMQAQYPVREMAKKAEMQAPASVPPPPPAATAMAQPTQTAPDAAIAVAPPEPKGTEDYRDYGVNPVVDPAKDRFSTFAIDVDTASYSITRRKLVEGSLPPFQAVRAEEFLNYFDYGYAGPTRGAFAVHLAAAPSPYTAGHHLVRIAIQGKRVPEDQRKPVHLVYLVDTSGSMQSPDKIGLVKQSLTLLTNSLRPSDTVALCTYAGSVREVLPPTSIDQKSRILSAIEDLTASGSTAMSSGIELAYRLAERTQVQGHVNRVIVLSDGDANVGATSHTEILSMIGRYKDKGITLSTVGFGDGNYKDTMMEQLADKGDGNYAYVDSDVQARRVFQEQLDGMLEVIARDVKVQVEFDPRMVKEYRLLGYENRDVADKDFRNDAVDGGEIGNGHSVTAVYDVVLKDTKSSPLVVRIRHKQPIGGDKASEQEFRMDPSAIAASFDAAPRDFRFAAAVAGFAEILRQSPHAREWSLGDVARIAGAAAIDRADQQEFVGLVQRAQRLATGTASAAVAR
jgi:Ca-activated chloride channel family protein